MSETPLQKPATRQVSSAGIPGEACFSKEIYWAALVLCFAQVILIWGFATYGYGYEYVLFSVLVTNLAIYNQIRHYLKSEATKKLNPFSVVTGYVTLTALFYSVPTVLVSMVAMLSTEGGFIPVVFCENNRSLVTWITGLELPGERPVLDLSIPKNVVNIYYLSLAYFAGTLSLVMSLPLLSIKVRGCLYHFEESAKARSPFQTPLRKLVFLLFASTACTWFLYCYQSKYTFGYELLPSRQFSPTFDSSKWRSQVQIWGLIGSSFSFFLSGAIAATINLFITKERNYD